MKQCDKTCLLCFNKSYSRNLCKTCYMKERRLGRLSKFKRILTPVSIETRIIKTNTCWMWTGDKTSYGYGMVTTGRGQNRVRMMAHRYVYTRLVGPIPDGMIVMHKCDNPPCVRPDHLHLGTIAENNADTGIKRRHHYGLDHWKGRLSDKDVSDIRKSDEKNADLARKFQVDPSHISRIKSGECRTRRKDT